MNNDSFLIEEFDLDNAKNICKLIENPDLRNKAVANVAAANFAEKYFQDCEVDTKSGLHNICHVLENIDISDIYIKDNYIDVRLYFNDNELFVPKSHFDNNLLPVAYMFIKVSEDLSNGLVTGFAIPSSIDTSTEYNGYYHVNEDDLISFYDVESNLINKYEEDLPDNFEQLVFDYLDNKLTDKNNFYNILLNSKEGREKLQNAAQAKIVFNFVSLPKIQETTDVELEEGIQEETETLLEVSDDTDFALADAGFDAFEEVENIGEIEEVGMLELEETPDLSFDDSDNIALDVEEFTPIEEEETSFSIAAAEDDDNDSATNDIIEEKEETTIKLNDDFDADSIKMLGAGTYEEQSFSNFAEEFQEGTSVEDKDDDFSISMIDSSTLTFDETPALDLEQETEEIKETEEAEEVVEEALALEITEEEEEEEPETQEIVIDEPSENIDEPDNFDFSTNVTPSLDTFEAEEQDEVVTDLTEESLNEVIEQEDVEANEPENAEQIDTLFNQEEQENAALGHKAVSKQKNMFLPIITVLAIIIALGYYGYTKFVVPQSTGNDIADNTQNAIQSPEMTEPALPVEDAMPVETVENVKVQLNTNEGNAISIPAIEQNLDASITVSNLRVEFEIPVGYKSSKTAERYFTKMGKIIQLNLKTELLLLTKQPITNKIAVELEYNKDSKKFDVKGIVASSGEQTIDNIILNTVKNALNINLNMNTGVFGNVAGNPILVIKL